MAGLGPGISMRDAHADLIESAGTSPEATRNLFEKILV
jgi:F0F1-type ATP synthase membrane subunit c/vacuolar-type H+-ATPase subunit K